MNTMSTPAQIIERLDGLRSGSVLCIGDVMLDRFIYGRVERISPEAPIPVMEIEREEIMLGSAGNVVRNIAGLGGTATLLSIIGPDAAGEKLEQLLSENSDVSATLVHDAARPTSIKTRYIAGTQQLLRADEETREALGETVRARLLELVDQELESCGAVILSDYGKGVLGGGLAADIIAKATVKGIPVAVDPSGIDYGIYRGAGLVTPNRKELAEATRLAVRSPAEVALAAESLIALHEIGAVLATLSGDGMLLVRKGSDPIELPAEAQEVFDVSGAGDTVIAVMSLAMAAGQELAAAAEIANTAAGIVVGKVGTAVAYADDVAAELRHRDYSTGEAKVMDPPRAADTVNRWRQNGQKIGFTNGCFDLVHPGHVSSLRQAKSACDRLVVGLNSDASTTRLKGPERPIQSESARAAVLASMADVDLVVIFGEDSPIALIETLRPDVYVKGADYNIEDIPEAKIVQSYGGEVMLAALEEGHSTTATIARLGK